jgi:PKD repeat protein
MGFETYSIDFGDGRVETGDRTSGVLTTHTYHNPSMYEDKEYTIKLTAYSYHCSDAITKNITVLATPVADFIPGNPYPDDFVFPAPPIQLENLISVSERENLNYLWSWNEPWTTIVTNFSIAINPEPLRLTDWGRYDITQRVTAPNGVCSDSKTIPIRIAPPLPIANFDDVDSACAPYDVQFINTSLYGVRYLWDFGDGFRSTQQFPYHTFIDAGTYNVRLTVMGHEGDLVDMIIKEVVVHPTPQPNFLVMPYKEFLGSPVRAFNYTNTNLPDGSPYDVWYSWDWGDGSPPDNVPQSSHFYKEPGLYTVTLTVGTFTEPQCVTTRSLSYYVEIVTMGEGNDFGALSSNLDLGNVISLSGGLFLTGTPYQSFAKVSGEVYLLAIPNAGNVFTGWNDGNTDNPRIVTVEEEITYTAIFEVCEECELGNITSSFEMQALNLNPLTVFPNPTGSIIYVQFENFVNNGVLSLYDVNGRTVLSQPVSGIAAQIDLSPLAAGSYILRLVENNKPSANVKVIKN